MSAQSQSELQAETEARLSFELLLSDVCARFVNVAASDVDSKIANAQRAICESVRIDHSSVWQVSEENPDLLVMTHVYRDPNLKPLPLRPIAKEYFPWSYNRILNKEIICVPNTATLPPEAAKDQESWEQYGIHSSLVVPLSVGCGSVIGVLAFDSERERDWPEPLQRRLQILAHVFAQALDRKDAERKVKMGSQALRASEERLRLAQQAARIGTFEWNIQTGLNTWTPELEAIYGLPPGSFGGTQTAFENLVHVDDRASVINLVNRALKTGQPTEGEWRVVWADGSVHWITGRWQVLMNESSEAARVIGVNIDVTDRKRAEEARLEVNRTLEAQTALLHTREELLKIFVKHVPAAVAMLDREMRYLQVSDRWCTDYLSGRKQIVGRSHYEIFPDMPERWKEVHRRALQGETLRADEDRWDGQDGPHWARWEVRPWNTPEGTVGGILILTEDITRRKRAEEALLSMSRKLIEAQEQERTRIGRELHDDINQRLAMLALELEQLQANPSEVQTRLQELRNRTTELSNDVQALSHELHSSKLEYMGVVSGIKSWCKEFGEHQKMEIDFKSDVSSVLPHEVGVCLFRVLQESLHNAAKHSAVKRVEVQLREVSNEIHLIVTDLGRGFDVDAAIQGQGLGLTSMQERVRLLNGSIEIQSKPMGGTTIHVRVPLGSEQNAKLAAG